MSQSVSLSIAASPLSTSEAQPVDLEFEAAYRQYFASVWRVLRRLGVAEAQLDDAAQDVFVVVHRRLGEFEARGTPRSWLYAIALRVASEYRRRAVRRRAEPLTEHADQRPSPGQQVELRESVRLLHALLAELDDDKRTVFVLAELEQLSVPEIATALGANINTIYTRLRAARRRFEAALHRHRARNGGDAR
jgi:RNA polymerase sigma-70 factor (ECF subfamily)